MKDFRYSNTNYEHNLLRGFSRPERCPDCRRQHSKEVNTVGQPYFKVKPRYPNVDHTKLESTLGRLEHPPRPHRAEHVTPPSEPADKFGIKDDKIIEMFRWFLQDPGLQVCVVVGPTGSGKSTYFPYRLVHPPRTYISSEPDPTQPEIRRTICGEDGEPKLFDASDVPADLFHRYGQIVVTQPRIQATRNIPGYIARSMLGSSLGAGFDIGYQYANNPASDWRSKLRFCTDGSLINWIATGQLDKINTVMIDEAHERSLNIDIIIGLLTQALPRYPRLKLIIASATIAADLFIDHFNKHLPGRSPAKLLHLGEETTKRRKLDLNERTTDAEGRSWLLKPADNCELMEFDGKSFRVDPHFHDGAPLDYAYLDPREIDKTVGEEVEARIRKLAKIAPEKTAEKAVDLLRSMYLTPDELRSGQGLRVTKSVDPDGTIPNRAPVIDVTERRGDVLIFLHGEAPIQDCRKLIQQAAADPKFPCKVEALPLFTQLPQSEQDKALLERTPGIQDKLVNRIVREVEGGANSVLAVHDNVGQFSILERLLKSRIEPDVYVQRWSNEDAVDLKPGSTCTRKTGVAFSDSAHQGVHIVIASSRALAVWDVPFDTTQEGSQIQLAGKCFAYVPQESETRRVVISTNVAETSLTIHGILHVVDSGLINQNKWMPDTQTTSVRAILQSRAGCKQRWGRAGRLQAGDAWPLYTREQFGLDAQVSEPFGSSGDLRCFPYYSQPEIRRSPLEQVLLTAKKAGLETLDVSNFPWLEAPDAAELKRAESSLKSKGALDSQGRLTTHGLELCSFQSDARLANLMVIADRMACAVEMATILAVLKVGYNKLLIKNKEWDEATAKRVQDVQSALIAPCRDDLEVALKLVAGWECARACGQTLSDLWKWRTQWTALATKYPDYHALLGAMANVADESEFASVRPKKDSPERKIYEDRRLEASRGLKLRQAWSQVASQWEIVTQLPGFVKAWKAAATELTRTEGVACEVLRVALNKPALPDFREFLFGLQSSSGEPKRTDSADGSSEPVSASVPADDDLIKFLTAIESALSKATQPLTARHLEPDGDDKDAKRLKAENDETWRKLDAIALEFVKNLGANYRQPPAASEHYQFAASAEACRSLDQLEALSGNPTWLDRVRAALPIATAQAWCDTHFVDVRAIADKDKIETMRCELIDALSGHKKEEERRLLNFAMLDRLRLIIAHALSDHCYALIDGAYQPLVAEGEPLPATIERDSICTGRSPALIVCANRRALPADASGNRSVGGGFVVVLDEVPGLTAAHILGENGLDPIAKWSALQLAAHLPSATPAQIEADSHTARQRMLMDQRFPLESHWSFKLLELQGEAWLAQPSLLELCPEPYVKTSVTADSGDEFESGGEFSSSTFAYEAPDPVLDPDASIHSDAPPSGTRPKMLVEGTSTETNLCSHIVHSDSDRHLEVLLERDDSAAPNSTASRPAGPTLTNAIKIQFICQGSEVVGDQIEGWTSGFEFSAGDQPIVLLSRRPRQASIAAIQLLDKVTVDVIGRVTGSRPGVRVTVRDQDLQVVMTARDFGFRDDDAVIESILTHWEQQSHKLSFDAWVWDTDSASSTIRLTTYPAIEKWVEEQVDLPTEGVLVRSSAANPDRCSIVIHNDPASGLVIAVETNAAQFADVPTGSAVEIRVSRLRDSRRLPETRRAVQPPPNYERHGLTLTKSGRVRYSGTRANRNTWMTVSVRRALIELDAENPNWRVVVNELFEQSNARFAESVAVAEAADWLAKNFDVELLCRVSAVNHAGAELKILDRQDPAAALVLWLSNRECGYSSQLAVGDLLFAQALGKPPLAGRLDVAARTAAQLIRMAAVRQHGGKTFTSAASDRNHFETFSAYSEQASQVLEAMIEQVENAFAEGDLDAANASVKDLHSLNPPDDPAYCPLMARVDRLRELLQTEPSAIGSFTRLLRQNIEAAGHFSSYFGDGELKHAGTEKNPAQRLPCIVMDLSRWLQLVGADTNILEDFPGNIVIRLEELEQMLGTHPEMATIFTASMIDRANVEILTGQPSLSALLDELSAKELNPKLVGTLEELAMAKSGQNPASNDESLNASPTHAIISLHEFFRRGTLQDLLAFPRQIVLMIKEIEQLALSDSKLFDAIASTIMGHERVDIAADLEDPLALANQLREKGYRPIIARSPGDLKQQFSRQSDSSLQGAQPREFKSPKLSQRKASSTHSIKPDQLPPNKQPLSEQKNYEWAPSDLVRRSPTDTDVRMLIDTCALMDNGFEAFANEHLYRWSSLWQSKAGTSEGDSDQPNAKVPALVLTEVIRELESLAGSDRVDAAKKANRAIGILHKLVEAGAVMPFDASVAYKQQPADDVIIAVIPTLLLNHDIILLTQDRALAASCQSSYENQRNSAARTGRMRNFKACKLFRDKNSNVRVATYKIEDAPDTQWDRRERNQQTIARRDGEQPRPNRPSDRGDRSMDKNLPDSRPQPRPQRQAPSIRQTLDNSLYEVLTPISAGSKVRAATGGFTLELGSLIMSGGEGSVYSVVGQDASVAKIYHPDKLVKWRISKLQAMLDDPVRNIGIAWPTDLLLTEEGTPVGFLMLRITSAQPIEDAVYGVKPLARFFPDWERKELVELAKNLASIIKILHERDIIIGDMNPANVLIKVEDGLPRVALVDTDSWQVAGYPSPVGKNEFTHPMIHGHSFESYLRTREHDEYALAILIFQILFLGRHPYAAVSDESISHAMREYNFPYPLDQQDDGSKVPKGQTWYIWTHLDYNVKKAFYSVFKRKRTITAADWVGRLTAYRLAIIDDCMDVHHNDNAISPEIPRIPKQRMDGPSIEMKCQVPTCERSETFYGESVIERVKKNRRFVCRYCRDREMHEKQNGESRICDECGDLFAFPLWFERMLDGRLAIPSLCDNHGGLPLPFNCNHCKRHFTVHEFDKWQLIFAKPASERFCGKCMYDGHSRSGGSYSQRSARPSAPTPAKPNQPPSTRVPPPTQKTLPKPSSTNAPRPAPQSTPKPSKPKVPEPTPDKPATPDSVFKKIWNFFRE
jgi:HrpA-like RNA helicase/serine/threonine protein kinase